jgi:dTDP-4-dehydrorhamnose reductase
MRVLLTGKNGQLGLQLQQALPAGIDLCALGHQELDITDRQQVMKSLQQLQPQVVINAAAYTAVDKAEAEPGLAHLINANGPEYLALACRHIGARLIHLSTDFVFNGTQSTPYKPHDLLAPLGAYGRSKADGERAVMAVLPEAVILRTAWVYAAHGSNFVNTMLRLMNERDALGVVADQVGTPTWTGTLARVIFALLQQPHARGIYHCTDAGVASWYDFAVAIYEEGRAAGLIPADKKVKVSPVTTADYPTPAQRPHYSVLDKSRLMHEHGLAFDHWRRVLRQVMQSKS